MKQLILITFFVLSTYFVEAKKFIFPFEIVVGTADIIVIGRIDNVKENSYNFKINETLKGKSFKTIKVEKFKEWTCDVRFGKVEKGQELCLFLKKGLTSWKIVNGSTGEIQIANDSIIIDGLEEYKQIDNQFVPYRISLIEFKKGIRDFCKCYEFVGKYEPTISKSSFRQICSEQQISTFKHSSKFSTLLYDKMLNYAIIKD